MTPLDASVVVVGAGPAGLSAAQALARGGERRILVLDRDDAAGGLPRFCHHAGFGWEYSHRLETGPRFARRLITALDPAAVTIATRVSALALRPGPELDIVGVDCGPLRLRPRAVILATGIRERPRSARLVPGRRPERGILTTGMLQQMVARGVPVAGRRAVVVGTEHVAFSVLLTARRAGLEIVAMIGSEDRVMSYAGATWFARMRGVPIHLSSAIEDIGGGARVDSVSVRGPTGSHRIACDTVIFSGDFIPDSAILHGSDIVTDRRTHGPAIDQYGRTSARGVFAAGNLLRAVESSGLAAIEGARVGANAAAFLRGESNWRDDQAEIGLGDAIAFLVPQRWARDEIKMIALPIALRALADIPRGRVRILEDGVERWSGRSRAILRQRRIALPALGFARLSGGSDARVTVDAR